MKKELLDALNKQIAMEEHASRAYLVLALWAEETGFNGAAKFFYKQTEEERSHMMKFIKYLLEVGKSPVISNYGEALHKPKSFKNMFEIALEHEQAVTRSIHKMVDLAIRDKEHPTFNFLQWFVEEQVEEEEQVQSILTRIKLIEEHGGSLYMLDHELARQIEN